MTRRHIRSTWWVPIAIPFFVGLMVVACSSAKGTCTNQTGTGVTTLGTSVTQGTCQTLCQDQLQRDDCVWVETRTAAQVVGPSALRIPIDHSDAAGTREAALATEVRRSSRP